jgi:hypothetical protein
MASLNGMPGHPVLVRVSSKCSMSFPGWCKNPKAPWGFAGQARESSSSCTKEKSSLLLSDLQTPGKCRFLREYCVGSTFGSSASPHCQLWANSSVRGRDVWPSSPCLQLPVAFHVLDLVLRASPRPAWKGFSTSPFCLCSTFVFPVVLCVGLCTCHFLKNGN